MRYLIIFTTVLFFFASGLKADGDNPFKTFSKTKINTLAESYVNNNASVENPAIVDVDGDGDFDILKFNDGNVEYYENKGSLDKPDFVLKDKNYDSYKEASFLSTGMPMPVFFADKDGDGDLDMFAVKEKGYNSHKQQNEYKIYAAENTLDLDTATLITIILILVIVLLLLAILR